MSALPDTRFSLLVRLHEGDDQQAWSEFVQTYQTGLFRYVRSRGLQDADAWEVVQEIFLAVHRSLESWAAAPRPGFRRWLLRVAYNLTITEVRRRARQAAPSGSALLRAGDVAAALDCHADKSCQVEPDEVQWRQWAFCWAAARVQPEVAPHVWQAFWLTAVENRDPAEVAHELDMTVGTVYAAKCRMLARLRTAVAELEQERGGP